MHNVATVYRFNTPFLDLINEKKHLVSVIKKIEKAISFDGINFSKKTENIWNYYKITLYFEDKLWRIEFFYISDLVDKYHLPIFKVNIFLSPIFLGSNLFRKRAVKFLNNIFECFDWLTEKEFLLDLNSDLYYKWGLFKSKKTPNYDFSDIETIRKLFEKKEWLVLVEDFIRKFSDTSFELSYEKSKYYHTLHSIFLYFVYLVFLMHQNIERTSEALEDINNINDSGLYEWQISLMNNRLSYVDDLQLETFNKYKNRLELFFKLF